MSELLRIVNDEIHKLEIREAQNLKRREELKAYRGQHLISSTKGNGRKYYYSVQKGNSKRLYLGSDSRAEVGLIKELHHVEKSLEVIGKDKELLIPVMKRYRGTDPDDIDALLSDVYRNCELNLYTDTDRRAIEWKREKEMFKAEYLKEHPEKHPESFKYQRRNGQWMRSKSEGTIADILDLNGLIFVYELPHFCNGIWIKSDFTILSPLDFKSEIIIEHAGRMDLESYRRKFIISLEAYMKAGYRPNIDLFFTFDNLDSTFSEIPVQNIIDNWLSKDGIIRWRNF